MRHTIERFCHTGALMGTIVFMRLIRLTGRLSDHRIAKFQPRLIRRDFRCVLTNEALADRKG